MRYLRGGASARAQYLLSKFVFTEVVENDGKRKMNFMAFDHQLPPAYTLSASIDMAMANEGLTVTPDHPSVEATAEQIHNIEYLMKLFVNVDPIRVDGKTHYHYHISKMFNAGLGATDPAAVIASAANYIHPIPLIGLHRDAEVYYSLHTALRRACSSKITSVAWNAFQGLSPDARRWVCSPIEAILKSDVAYETVEEFISAAQTACIAAEYFGSYEQTMIHCMYEQFDQRDWDGYLSYLIKWEFDTKVPE